MKPVCLAIVGVISVALPFTTSASETGRQLFMEKCTTCHGVEQAKMGPSVRDMAEDPALLKSAITDGVESDGPFPMPVFGDTLKPEQIEALVDYIRSQQQ